MAHGYYQGFVEVRGAPSATLAGEARLPLPARDAETDVVLEGYAGAARPVEVRAGGAVIGRFAPSGDFRFAFRVPQGAACDLTLRVLERAPTAFDRLQGREIPAVNDRAVEFKTIRCGATVLADFARPGRAFFPDQPVPPGCGMNIVGFFDRRFGIAESARCMARAARAAGVPHAAIPCKVGTSTPGGDEEFAGALRDGPEFPVNVFHLDAPQMELVDAAHGPALRAGRRNIAYWAWELPDFPDLWVRHFQFADEVWVPSGFVRDAVARAAPVPVHVMPHAFAVPAVSPGADADRTRWGLGEEPCFLCAFDLHSSRARKNPDGTVEAFRRAFAPGAPVRLAIKVHGAEAFPDDAAALRALASGDPRIRLIEGTFSREDLASLMAACDVFVSLHRAEGFGMALAEAMALGKPVVATGWSGNTDFMDETCACPVRWTLSEIRATSGPYRVGGTWAEPDLDDAAAWLARLAGDAALRARIGAAARERVRGLLSPERIGGLYADRLRALSWWG